MQSTFAKAVFGVLVMTGTFVLTKAATKKTMNFASDVKSKMNDWALHRAIVRMNVTEDFSLSYFKDLIAKEENVLREMLSQNEDSRYVVGLITKRGNDFCILSVFMTREGHLLTRVNGETQFDGRVTKVDPKKIYEDIAAVTGRTPFTCYSWALK